MAYSSMVTVKIMSPNMNKQRTYKVTRITPHCMVGQLSAKRCGELFSKESRGASSNYGIGTGGEVGLYVDEADRSWCTSSADNDNRAVTIECASNTSSPYAMNEKVWDTLIALCVDICRRYGKNTLIWFGDKKTSINYKPRENEMILTAHRWFAAKSCPGDWLYNRLGKLAEKVNAKLSVPSSASVQRVEETPNTEAAKLITNEEPEREKKVWDFLTGKGLSAFAAAGIMGNLYAESAMRPNNLQNVYEKKLGYSDKGYTNAVNNGSYKNFVRDGAGYGLAQWTFHTRKQGLLDFAKKRGASIDDMDMQLEFLWKELTGGYSFVMDSLKTANTVRKASDAVLIGYEKPANQGTQVQESRAKKGQEYYDRYAKKTQESSQAPKKTVYCVQFGAFATKANAEKKVQKARDKGLSPDVVKEDGLYKVRFGEFKTVSDANTAASSARKAGFKVIIKEMEA